MAFIYVLASAQLIACKLLLQGERWNYAAILNLRPLDKALNLLNGRLEAFAICEIGRTYSLKCAPFEKLILHFVLQGEGSVEWEHDRFPIGPGMMIVAPSGLAKRINGEGPILTVVDAQQACPLEDGIFRFKACETKADLVIGCASVSASLRQGSCVLWRLLKPVSEQPQGGAFTWLFQVLLAELQSPAPGTKQVVESIMKQIVVLLLRSRAGDAPMRSLTSPPFVDQRIGRALLAMIERPQDPHSLDDLARCSGMSRSGFTSRFAALQGQSPMNFLQSVRLTAAAQLLRGSALPVNSIAAAVRFASRSHFSRAFRNQFGTNPSAFRASACGEQRVGNPSTKEELRD